MSGQSLDSKNPNCVELETVFSVFRKSSKFNLAYCRPDQVFLMYTNDLFLNQLEILLERVSQSMTKLSCKSPFAGQFSNHSNKLTFKGVLLLASILIRDRKME